MSRKIALIAAMVMTACMTGCGETSPQVPAYVSETDSADVITIMSIDADKADYQAYIKNIEEELGITIKLRMPDQDANNREAQFTMLLSTEDSSVDIFTLNDEMLSEYKKKGYLEAIPDSVAPEKIVSSYPQEYLNTICRYDGNLYAIPFYMDIYMLWVNQKYLDKAGIESIEDLEDFTELLETVSSEDVSGYGGAWEKTYSYNDIFEFINMFGGECSDWNDPKTREALTYMHDMVEGGATGTDQLIDQYDQVVQKLIDGKYASAFLYSGTLYQASSLNVYSSETLHVIPLPNFGSRQTNVASWSYAVNAASEHKESVWKFLKYAADEGAASYCNAMHRLPARLDVLQEDINIKDIDILRMYADNYSLKPRMFTDNPMDGIETIGELFSSYVTGEITLDEFCEEAPEIE